MARRRRRCVPKYVVHVPAKARIGPVCREQAGENVEGGTKEWDAEQE